MNGSGPCRKRWPCWTTVWHVRKSDWQQREQPSWRSGPRRSSSGCRSSLRGWAYYGTTGSGRPVPSEIQLTSTGTEMTTEEHVVTAETHLRYAEGHLQPSEEHLADAEVHLKLVKAHLAALDVAEPAEADPPETATPPPPKPSDGKTGAGRAEVAPEESDRSPATRPRAGPVQRGRKPAGKAEGTPPPGVGEEWACPVNECQDSAAHPLDECEDFRSLSVTQRRKALKE
jgi:hypothetical protein